MSDTPRDADAERLECLRRWYPKILDEADQAYRGEDNIAFLLRVVAARDAALRKRDAEIARLRNEKDVLTKALSRSWAQQSELWKVVDAARKLSDHGFNCPGYYERKACDCGMQEVHTALAALDAAPQPEPREGDGNAV